MQNWIVEACLPIVFRLKKKKKHGGTKKDSWLEILYFIFIYNGNSDQTEIIS